MEGLGRWRTARNSQLLASWGSPPVLATLCSGRVSVYLANLYSPPINPVDRVCEVLQWGAVERQPGVYDFSGYRALLESLKLQGLRMQAVMSFHACGGNVNDVAQISLPEWVLKVCRS